MVVWLHNTMSRNLFGCAISLLSVVLHRECNPYMDRSDNFLAMLLQWLMLLWMVGLVCIDLHYLEGWPAPVTGTPPVVAVAGIFIAGIVTARHDVMTAQNFINAPADTGANDSCRHGMPNNSLESNTTSG